MVFCGPRRTTETYLQIRIGIEFHRALLSCPRHELRGVTIDMANLSIEGDSPEVVAYALMCCIASKKGMLSGKALITAEKDWLFTTYNECLRVARGELQSSTPK